MTPKLLSRYPALKGSLFIVTYGRSGSTLLQSILQTIPGAHIMGENYGTLFQLYQASQQVRRSKRVWGKKEKPPNSPWHGADRLRPQRFVGRLTDLFVEEVLQPPRDARWIGFKEIRYPLMKQDLEPFLDFLRQHFPNARIVFNSRNAGDVAKSKWWGRRPEEEIRAMVADMDARFAAYAANHPDSCYHARYEQTKADPMCLLPLFEKLGEPLSEADIQAVLDTRLTH